MRADRSYRTKELKGQYQVRKYSFFVFLRLCHDGYTVIYINVVTVFRGMKLGKKIKFVIFQQKMTKIIVEMHDVLKNVEKNR